MVERARVSRRAGRDGCCILPALSTPKNPSYLLTQKESAAKGSEEQPSNGKKLQAGETHHRVGIDVPLLISEHPSACTWNRPSKGIERRVTTPFQVVFFPPGQIEESAEVARAERGEPLTVLLCHCHHSSLVGDG